MIVIEGFVIAAFLILLLYLSRGSITMFFLFVMCPAGLIGGILYTVGGGPLAIIGAAIVLVLASLLKRALTSAEIGNMHDLESNGSSELNLREQLNSAGIVARSMRDRPWDTTFVSQFLASLSPQFRPTEQQIQDAIDQASGEGRIFHTLNANSGKWHPTKNLTFSQEYKMLSNYLIQNQVELGLSDREVNQKLYDFMMDSDRR